MILCVHSDTDNNAAFLTCRKNCLTNSQTILQCHETINKQLHCIAMQMHHTVRLSSLHINTQWDKTDTSTLNLWKEDSLSCAAFSFGSKQKVRSHAFDKWPVWSGVTALPGLKKSFLKSMQLLLLPQNQKSQFWLQHYFWSDLVCKKILVLYRFLQVS